MTRRRRGLRALVALPTKDTSGPKPWGTRVPSGSVFARLPQPRRHVPRPMQDAPDIDASSSCHERASVSEQQPTARESQRRCVRLLDRTKRQQYQTGAIEGAMLASVCGGLRSPPLRSEGVQEGDRVFEIIPQRAQLFPRAFVCGAAEGATDHPADMGIEMQQKCASRGGVEIAEGAGDRDREMDVREFGWVGVAHGGAF